MHIAPEHEVPEHELQGRVALVTGASQGIGRAVVEALTDAGANVVAVARGAAALERLAADRLHAPGAVQVLPLDATAEGAARRSVAVAAERFGRLDILVNNVGGPRKIGTFDELSDDEWLDSYRFNVMTVVHFTREALPLLRQSPAGRIINVASIVGVEPGQLAPDYCASKAAVINLTKHLSNRLAGDGILVNVICPGQVDTEHRRDLAEYMARRENLSLEEAHQRIDAQGAERIPLGRIGRPADIAELARFLASDRAAWMTGACLHLNGGKTRSAF